MLLLQREKATAVTSGRLPTFDCKVFCLSTSLQAQLIDPLYSLCLFRSTSLSWPCGPHSISQRATTASMLMSSIMKSEKHSGFGREDFLGLARNYLKSFLKPSRGVTIGKHEVHTLLGHNPSEGIKELYQCLSSGKRHATNPNAQVM